MDFNGQFGLSVQQYRDINHWWFVIQPYNIWLYYLTLKQFKKSILLGDVQTLCHIKSL